MFSSTKISHNPEIESTARWAFKLSYFLLADRRDACSVLYQATSRLYVTALTQKKRQAKRPKNEIHKKLILTPRQLLQYLTYLCAEPYEGMQEQEHRAGTRALTLEDMIVRYVKHLMLLYLEHNSFYATVGQSCILFDLGTSQAERLYEVLVQGSPAHLDTKGDYSVRDAKREIRQRLGRRFEGFLTNSEGARREQHFETMADAGPHFLFVKRCLHRLQPVEGAEEHWSRWHLPAHFDLMAYDLFELQYDESNADPRAEQAAELRRLHAVTHPCCWARLLRASCHNYSRRRVVLPEFKLNSFEATDHMPPSDRQNPPELTPAELKGLTEMLKGEARRRKGLFASQLSISVDGSPRGSWDIYRDSLLQVRVEEGSRVLEVSAKDAEGELLLAQYLLGLDGGSNVEGGEPASITLESGQEFTFTISHPSGVGEGSLVTIQFRETKLHRALAGYLDGRSMWLGGLRRGERLTPAKLKTATAFAALLAVLLTGLWAARIIMRPRPSPIAEAGGSVQPSPQPSPRISPQTSPRPLPAPPLSAEALRRPGEGERRAGEGGEPPTADAQRRAPPVSSVTEPAPLRPKAVAARAPRHSQKNIIALQDGGSLVTLDEQGRYKGLEGIPNSWQTAIRETLLAQRVKRPAILDAVGDGAGAILRGSGDGIPFDIISPAGAVVESDRPLFRWGALRGATSYSAVIFDYQFNRVAESGPISATEWTPPQALRRGATYFWQVTAILDGEAVLSPGAAAPEAKFSVLGWAETEELKRARLKVPGSHLTLGVLYAQAGLLDEAEREFKSLVEANPKSLVALKLLRSLQELRRAK
jgi:hypothetical protein